MPVALLATAVFRRSGHKYGERTYRYLLGDLGHALENVRVAGQALHVGVHFARAFDESVWADALQLDEREEGVLAQLWLTDAAATPRPVAPPADWAIPLRQGSAPLGMTDAVHRATSLRAAASGAGSVRASPTDRPPPAGADWPPPAADSPAMGRAAAVALPAASGPVPALADPLPLIAARRSVRRYRPQALPLPVLGQLLRAMTTPAPQWSAAVRASVVAHAVDGLPAGAWAWVPVADALHARPAAGAPGRRRSRAAGLDQDAIGDAAAVVVLTLDRGAFAADPAGAARGWRHAFLESGLWGERLYLAGQALGVGVCAVGAFYDDEAAALIGADPAREWVVHFAALGWPA